MQESYSYTQTPDNSKLFTITDLQRISGASSATIREIAERARIETSLNKEGRVVYSFQAMKQIVGIYRNYLKISDVRKMNRKTAEPKTIEQLRAEHPLVKDDRFFKLSYFPEIVPKCFTDDL